jgi:trans-aconitate 2-methyltransferase
LSPGTRGQIPPWNAASYDTVSTVQQAWGRQVLAETALRGDETVLDAGCGTARLAELLAAAVPRGLVLAVDHSAEMLGVAASRLRGGGHPIVLLRAELMDLPLRDSVDFVFSNAVFHWVPDHQRLFRSLAAALRPGGRLVAQCGGHGNLARAHQIAFQVARQPRFAPWFRDWREPYVFATAEETRARLERAGFVEVSTSLVAAPTPFPTRQAYREFVATVILRSFLGALPKEDHAAFVETFVDSSPEYHLDYVRLNLSGKKG